jgi:hypothetical protein
MKISNFFKMAILTLIIGSTAVAAQNMPMPQAAPADSVTDAEIEEFVMIAQEIQKVRMEMDSLVVAKLDEEGMTTARFQEIMQNAQNPQGQDLELTTKEEATVANMKIFLQEISMKAQKDQMASIQSSDMSQQRFQSIAQALQTDKDLVMRFQEIASEIESR